jgi:hypothetical protein
MPTRPGQSPVEDLPYAPMGPGRNVGKADRQAFRNALESRSGLTPTMRSIFDYVFDFEGGYRPDKSDRRNAPDRYPVTGILQNTLREYQDAFYKANPEVRSATSSKFFKPGELNDQQRIALMKWYADTRMGDLDINEIARPSTPGTTGDPKLGGLVYDTYYRWGRGRANGVVRGAIAATLKRYRSGLVAAGINPDDLAVPKQFDLHGGPDSEVRDAIMLLLKAGRSDALRSAIITRVSKLPGASSDNDAYRRSVFK